MTQGEGEKIGDIPNSECSLVVMRLCVHQAAAAGLGTLQQLNAAGTC